MAKGGVIGNPRPWSRERFERVKRGAKEPTPWLVPSPAQGYSRGGTGHCLGDSRGDSTITSDNDMFFDFDSNSSLSMSQYFDNLERNGAPESTHWSP